MSAAPVVADPVGTVTALSVELPAELVELIAQRAAAILADRTPTDEAEGFMDVAGAAEFLACPASRIYALVSAKRLPVHRDGSRLLFRRDELRDYIDRGGARRP